MPEQKNISPPEKEELVKKARSALGWPLLLNHLSGMAASEPGKGYCLDPDLFETAEACELALQETDEALKMFESQQGPPATPIKESIPAVERARAGAALEPADLISISGILKHSEEVRSFYTANAGEGRLYEWASRLDACPALAKRLEMSIDPDGAVLDTASPELKSLRDKHRTLKSRIHRKLADIVTRNPDTVLQDSFYTQRSQRYVVPVKASERDKFQGIVHDASASGQTVFVEPAELVEQNNRLKMIESGIEAEVMRVLKELSADVEKNADGIITNQRVLVHLDAVRARAMLARKMGANRPRVNSRGEVWLKAARHPLLAIRDHEVVPNDIQLGKELRVLVISGPNTGGKTVCLSMLGLIALMTRAGMFVTAGPDSEMCLLKDVYAVMRDEQDLALDLSSFSAHMLDIIGILDAAGEGSLVLLDEIMGSTDPEEGAALAASVLCALRQRGALVAATTHLPGLKSFVHQEEGFMNAGFDFDPHSLTPTYRLIMDVPGRSLGVEIAKRLGLEGELIQKARAEMDAGAERMESLLGELSKKIEEAAGEREELEDMRRGTEALAAEYRGYRDKAKEHENKIKKRIRASVRDAVRQAERELEGIVSPVKRRTPLREEVLSARSKVRDFKEKVGSEYGPEEDEVEAEPLDWTKVEKGDRVMVMPLGVEAEIMERPPRDVRGDTEVLLKMGKVKVKVHAEKIRAAPEGREAPAEKNGAGAGGKGKGDRVSILTGMQKGDAGAKARLLQTPANTLDLRGHRAHEAETEVDAFLDRSCRGNMPNVYIIHGHGTGALRQVVREQLALSPYVESFRPGERDEGGDGVTVVFLKGLSFTY